MPTSVLVVGATGTQGGAVVNSLLESDHEYDVYGLTRDTGSSRATALADRGVEMVEGDLNDLASLRPHVERVDAAYGMTDFWSVGSFEGELEQGENIGAAAEAAGLDHLVFSSIENCDKQPGAPVIDVKHEIEEAIRGRDVPTTVLWTHNFMQNFERQREAIVHGEFALPLDEGVRFRLLDVADIGAAVDHILREPERYRGRTVELAGDEHTLESMTETFSAVTGVDVKPVRPPIEAVREEMGEGYGDIFEWHNEREHERELSEIQAEVPIEFTTLEAYLRANEWGS